MGVLAKLLVEILAKSAVSRMPVLMFIGVNAGLILTLRGVKTFSFMM